MAVAFDAVGPSSSGANGTASPLTWSHTCGASATLLMASVAVGQFQTTADSTYTVSATYNGVAMTAGPRQSSHATGVTGNVGFIQPFYLLSPPTGSAYTVSVSVSGAAFLTLVGGSVSFTGAAALGSFAAGFASSVTSGSIGVAGTTAGNMCIAFLTDGSGGEAWTAGTQRWKNDAATNSGAGASTAATLASPGGTGTLSWTMSSDGYGVVAVEVQGAAVTGPGPQQQRGGSTYRRQWNRPQQPVPPAPPAVLGLGAATLAGTGSVDAALATQAPGATLGGAGSLAAAANPPFPAGVAGGGTGYFTDQYGKPILPLADAPKGLPANAGRWNGGNWQKDYDDYLNARAAQKFNLVFVNPYGIVHTGAPDNTGNTWDGVAPFTTPWSVLNNTFWTRIDYLVSKAASLGITVVMGICYYYNMNGPAVPLYGMTNADGTAYGTALGNRYKNSPNIIWFFGDDYNGGLDSLFAAIIDAIHAAGDTHLATIEYYSTGTTSRYDISGSPATAFTWGSTYASYNWTYYYGTSYFGTEFAYQEASPIPVVWADGMFWGELAGGAAANDQTMRNQSWWALSSGSRGFGTGDNGVWTWGSGSLAAVTGDGSWFTLWAPAIRTYIQGLPNWYLLIPDTSSQLVTAGRGTRASYTGSTEYSGTTDAYVTASRAPDGSLAVIYLSHATTITVDESKMAAGYTATWVDPASCATTPATTGSTYNSAPLGNNSAGNPDWALVLQGPGPAAVQPAMPAQRGGTAWRRRFGRPQQQMPPQAVTAVTVPGAATLGGAGSVDAAAAAQQAGATLGGAGSVAAAAALAAPAALTGTGSLSAAVTQGAGAALAAAGSLAAPAALGAGATLGAAGSLGNLDVTGSPAALTGAGALATAATLAAPAALAAAGSLAAPAVQAAGATLAAAGSLAGAGSGSGASLGGAGSLAAPAILSAPAVLGGTGSLATAAALSAPAALAAAGSLTAPAVQAAAGSLAGTGSLATAVTQRAAGTLAGTGTLSASAGGQQSGAGSLAGTGSLAAPAALAPPAALPGTGSLNTAAVQAVTAALAGAGSLGTAGTLKAPATLAAAGSLSAAGGIQGAGPLSATGSVGAPPAVLTAATALAGTGSLATAVTQRAAGTLAGTGTLSATGAIQVPFTAAVLTARDAPAGVLTAVTQATGGPS